MRGSSRVQAEFLHAKICRAPRRATFRDAEDAVTDACAYDIEQAKAKGLVIAKAAPRWLRIIACVGMLTTLSACGNSAMDFTSWVTRYNHTVDRAQNKLLLLNVMRASGNMPLLFTGVQVVRGNGSISSGITLGGSASNSSTSQLGTQSIYSVGTTLLPSASLQVSDGFNFDVAVLDTSEFYQGLLTPISVDTFHHYVSQGLPAELLLHLLVEHLTITENGVRTTHANLPGTPGHASFRANLSFLLKAGISTETVVSRMPVGPILRDNELKDVRALAAGTQGGLVLDPVPGGYRLVRFAKFSRFCFMAAARDAPTVPQSTLCATSPQRRGPHEATQPLHASRGDLETGNFTIQIQTRSTRNLFSYLGSVVRGQTEAGVPPLALESPEGLAFDTLGKGHVLFRVVKNDPRPDDIASVDYRGALYSVPNDQQGHSATVMSLMVQLLSLSKSVNSVPNTGTVVVR